MPKKSSEEIKAAEPPDVCRGHAYESKSAKYHFCHFLTSASVWAGQHVQSTLLLVTYPDNKANCNLIGWYFSSHSQEELCMLVQHINYIYDSFGWWPNILTKFHKSRMYPQLWTIVLLGNIRALNFNSVLIHLFNINHNSTQKSLCRFIYSWRAGQTREESLTGHEEETLRGDRHQKGTWTPCGWLRSVGSSFINSSTECVL